VAQSASDDAWSRSIAELVIDALVTAELVPKDDFGRAVEIAKEEILVRLTMGDRPEGRQQY
jgi:hypothetical protein